MIKNHDVQSLLIELKFIVYFQWCFPRSKIWHFIEIEMSSLEYQKYTIKKSCIEKDKKLSFTFSFNMEVLVQKE